jgi:hypothetical protein
VGNQRGGYFFLPPWDAWALWAREEIQIQRQRIDSLEVWIDGKRFKATEPLQTAHNKALQAGERRVVAPALLQRDSRAARG